MKAQATRLMKEARMLQSELPGDIVCTPREESLDRYHAQISGPPDTPYEHGRFDVDVALSDRYPMEPPSMRFETRIYHPNIDDHGNICLDVLKSGKSGCWNPSWTLAKVLVALSVLLATPNPHDPLMPEIADLMLNDRPTYVAAARDWTTRYATPSTTADSSEALASSPAKRRKVSASAGRPPAPVPSPGRLRKPSPGPDRPPALPATGIRRLGLSRSHNSVPKTVQPRASQSSQGSSQPESIDMTSDDSIARQRAAPPRTRNAKLSQILAPSKPRRAVQGRAGSAASQASQEPATDEGPGPDDDSDDGSGFECLLGSSNPSDGHDSSPPAAADDPEPAINSSPPAIPDPGSPAGTDPEIPAIEDTPPATSDSQPVVAQDRGLPAASDSEIPAVEDAPLAVKDPEPVAAQDSGPPAPDEVSEAPAVTVATEERPPEHKSKGKGVDRAVAPARGTVLYESHFGPLDLGLPPVRVSGQRRLLRRTRDTA
ncbi:hypothetical protein H4R19_000159 [Coemansia spiralis]|nr:hypothetical protein H4R19_000159 [Coemansia spiralis]